MAGITTRSGVEQQYASGRNLERRCGFHERFSENPYGWFRWVFDQFAFADGTTIVEIGCGTGSLWRATRQRVDPSWSLLLTDVSAGMVREASGAVEGLACRTALCVGDAQMIPAASASADVVMANHMLYHVPDLQSTLREVARVLKPGGQLVATTVGKCHLQEIGDLIRPFLSDPERWAKIMPHQFVLETGPDDLAGRFQDIVRHDYVDAFIVTEAEALLGYVLSMPVRDELEPQADALLEHLREQMARSGGRLRITKSSGMLLARRPWPR